MKEQSLKRRKEKFDPEKETTMVEKIAEQNKHLEEEAEQEIAVTMPLPKTERSVATEWVTRRPQRPRRAS